MQQMQCSFSLPSKKKLDRKKPIVFSTGPQIILRQMFKSQVSFNYR
jgi:hypothetical protein